MYTAIVKGGGSAIWSDCGFAPSKSMLWWARILVILFPARSFRTNFQFLSNTRDFPFSRNREIWPSH